MRSTLILFLTITGVLCFGNIIYGQGGERAVEKSKLSPIEMQQEGKGIRACCPKIWEESFGKYFRVHQLPGKNITQTYGVEFLPDAAMDTQMKVYAPYAGTYAPAGWTANSVLLVAEMRKVATPLGLIPTSADFNAVNSAPSSPHVVWINLAKNRNEHALRGWWTSPSSGIWNGPYGPGSCATVPWERTYMDGICSKATDNHMTPNAWYVIRLKLQLASKKNGIPDSWRQDDISCSMPNARFVAIAVRSASFRMAPNTTISPKDAEKILKESSQIIEVN